MQDIGGREGCCMKKKTRRISDQPVGKLTAIHDFLPPPEKLLQNEEKMKITITLDAATVRYFKTVASKMGLKYQRMMREVLKGYATRYA